MALWPEKSSSSNFYRLGAAGLFVICAVLMAIIIRLSFIRTFPAENSPQLQSAKLGPGGASAQKGTQGSAGNGAGQKGGLSSPGGQPGGSSALKGMQPQPPAQAGTGGAQNSAALGQKGGSAVPRQGPTVGLGGSSTDRTQSGRSGIGVSEAVAGDPVLNHEPPQEEPYDSALAEEAMPNLEIRDIVERGSILKRTNDPFLREKFRRASRALRRNTPPAQ